MKPEDLRSSQAIQELASTLDEALDLLREFTGKREAIPTKNQTPASLLEQCLNLCAEHRTAAPEPVRTIHHFACTGGTLISKCLAAMPNTQVISEVDPLSTRGHPPGGPSFAPTDMIQLMRQSTRGADMELLVSMFLSNLEIIHANSVRTGARLILRDHPHSHYCIGPEIEPRPNFRSIVASRLPVVSVVTTRNPIDSYLSLEAHYWVQFEPATFDEYCKRYLAFLDAHEGVPIIKYEVFVEQPQQVMQQMCQLLQLTYSDEFSELFSVFAMTGDSGRKGDTIEHRGRRTGDQARIEQMASSINYQSLKRMLGYD